MGVRCRMGQGAMIEDDEPKPQRRRLEPPMLDSWGEAELSSYIDELRAEILRAQAEIERKRGHREAAAAFFRLP
jgi:uncharacterized small protein (DUF1192 family)